MPDDPNQSPLTYDSAWQAKVHARWQAQRRRTIAALYEEAERQQDPNDLDLCPPMRRLANKLAACCEHPQVMQREDTGQIVVSSDKCNSRICPRCGKQRANELRRVVREVAKQLIHPGMITLTIARRSESLANSIDRLKQAWARLRRSKGWQSHVRGGISVMEITYNSTDDAWHPHLHVLADFDYWPQSELANAWEQATGDSRITDVRRLTNRQAMANYVTKYVTKSQDVERFPSYRLAEWAQALHGRRLAQPFGSMHGTRTTEPKADHGGQLTRVGPLGPLYEASREGDETANAILQKLLQPTTRSISDAAVGSTSGDFQADRETAKQLRDWWSAKQGARCGDNTRGSDTRSGRGRPPDRSQRLWQDPDDAAAASGGKRHPDSHALPE
jgi:hypothetical protein